MTSNSPVKDVVFSGVLAGGFTCYPSTSYATARKYYFDSGYRPQERQLFIDNVDGVIYCSFVDYRFCASSGRSNSHFGVSVLLNNAVPVDFGKLWGFFEEIFSQMEKSNLVFERIQNSGDTSFRYLSDKFPEESFDRYRQKISQRFLEGPCRQIFSDSVAATTQFSSSNLFPPGEVDVRFLFDTFQKTGRLVFSKNAVSTSPIGKTIVQCSKLQSENDKLQSEVARLKSVSSNPAVPPSADIIKLKRETEVQREKIDELNTKIRGQEGELTSLKEENDALKADIAKRPRFIKQALLVVTFVWGACVVIASILTILNHFNGDTHKKQPVIPRPETAIAPCPEPKISSEPVSESLSKGFEEKNGKYCFSTDWKNRLKEEAKKASVGGESAGEKAKFDFLNSASEKCFETNKKEKNRNEIVAKRHDGTSTANSEGNNARIKKNAMDTENKATQTPNNNPASEVENKTE